MTFSDSSPSVSGDIPNSGAPGPESAVVANAPSVSPDTNSSDATSAPASGAPEGESKESLLSAVMKVVKPSPDADKLKLPGDEAPPASSEPKPETADGQDAAQEDLPEDPSQEELGRYHSRTRKRIEKLLDQRNQARTEAEFLRNEAQVAQGVRQYLQTNDITKEDFAVLLDLGAALRRGDWQTFYAGVKPYVQIAEEALGVTLPQDLAQRVRQGHMTTEAARRFSQERYARQTAEANAQRVTAHVQNQEFQQQVAHAQHVIADAVTNWENQIRQTDPDYGMKQDAVKNLLWAVVREHGAPESPEHAVEIAKEAYRRANELTSRFAPKPRATAPVPSSIHRSTGATAEPKSLMEAAMLGLQRSHRSA